VHGIQSLGTAIGLRKNKYSLKKTADNRLRVMQGDSGGRLNIFGSYSIGHCERKNSYEYGSHSERLQRRSYLNLQIKKWTVSGNTGRGITYC
jgi:hypothetical protein